MAPVDVVEAQSGYFSGPQPEIGHAPQECEVPATGRGRAIGRANQTRQFGFGQRNRQRDLPTVRGARHCADQTAVAMTQELLEPKPAAQTRCNHLCALRSAPADATGHEADDARRRESARIDGPLAKGRSKEDCDVEPPECPRGGRKPAGVAQMDVELLESLLDRGCLIGCSGGDVLPTS